MVHNISEYSTSNIIKRDKKIHFSALWTEIPPSGRGRGGTTACVVPSRDLGRLASTTSKIDEYKPLSIGYCAVGKYPVYSGLTILVAGL